MIHEILTIIVTGAQVLAVLIGMLFIILGLGAVAKVTLDALDWLFS
jgi:hypothetical protein